LRCSGAEAPVTEKFKEHGEVALALSNRAVIIAHMTILAPQSPNMTNRHKSLTNHYKTKPFREDKFKN